MASQPTFTVFAVAGGAGSLGRFVTLALQGQGAKVSVLSRNAVDIPSGASLSIVDYTSMESLVSALSDVEVVVSVLSGPGMAAQPLLAKAAKAAGVKHFVPSEYGMRTGDLPTDSLLSVFADKVAMHELLRQLELPYTLYYVGVFSDWFFIPLFGFDFDKRKITIVGPGTTPVSWTSRRDIAYFIAYTLTHVPAAQLANRELNVEGEELSFNEVVNILEGARGETYEIVHRNVNDVQRSIESERGRMALVAPDFILLAAHKGYLHSGVNDNDLVPAWQPQPVQEVVKDMFQHEG
ncbi:NAD(P)-binding protein [Auriculariales sp. MPI-PUGE-AT-0066]|nr:NAD(P)-binding protein [Auriculariales sp. MPI-PUGE-AT-0066]